MKALSIRQPWAWAILHAGKRIENREWDPRGGNVAEARRLILRGGAFLIHAAKRCTRDEYEDASYAIDLAADRQDLAPPLKSLPRGAIVGRARLVALAYTDDNGHRLLSLGVPDCQRCGSGELSRVCARRDPWAIPGTIGLIVADVEALREPAAFKGALGFFDVPDELVRLP